MIDVSAIGIDSLLVCLLRQIVGGDFSDGDLWLCFELNERIQEMLLLWARNGFPSEAFWLSAVAVHPQQTLSALCTIMSLPINSFKDFAAAALATWAAACI
ncbi:hypothetical protein V6N13_145127 [Hibiscus sabdariffa]